jgi:hypothetical protein
LPDQASTDIPYQTWLNDSASMNNRIGVNNLLFPVKLGPLD